MGTDVVGHQWNRPTRSLGRRLFARSVDIKKSMALARSSRLHARCRIRHDSVANTYPIPHLLHSPCSTISRIHRNYVRSRIFAEQNWSW